MYDDNNAHQDICTYIDTNKLLMIILMHLNSHEEAEWLAECG